MKLHIAESNSSRKITGRTWEEFIDNIYKYTEFSVGSRDQERYSRFITLFDSNLDYEAEVTKYFDGTYELILDNIHEVGYDDKEYGPSNPWDAPGMSAHDFI